MWLNYLRRTAFAYIIMCSGMSVRVGRWFFYVAGQLPPQSKVSEYRYTTAAGIAMSEESKRSNMPP